MARTAVLSALAIVVLGAALVWFLRPTAYFPVADVAAPEGLSLSFLQNAQPSEAACQEANRRATRAMLANCAECRLDAARCAGSAPAELGAASGGAHDMIRSKGLTILITAPPAAAHALCHSLAAGIAAGDPGAACIPAAD
jgi:hypothetical protein